jgi:hypothetical protein
MMFSFALLFFLFSTHPPSLVTSSSSPSSSVSPPSPSICCEYLKQSSQLISCLRNHSFIYSPPHFPPPKSLSSSSSSSSPSILFLVFASHHIYHYAALTLLINSQYLVSHHYDLVFLTDSESDNNSRYDYFPQDRRWNKIGGVIDALDPQDGWGRHVDYLIAIDADLIILDDHNFNLPNLLSITSNSYSHLLLSADTSDIANTGFMIIKNSKWSYSFFQTWYASRYSFDCDQHAFNDLYSKLKQTKAKGTQTKFKIQILEPNEINTKFPVSANYQETDPVLHLMGERDIIRTAIFEYAAESYCWEYLEQNDPFYGNDDEEEEGEEEKKEREIERKKRSVRYGITRQVLTSIIQEQLLIPINQQHALCSDLLYEAPPHEVLQRSASDEQIHSLTSQINECFAQLHSFTSDLCDFGKDIVQVTKECTDLYEKNYLLAKKGTSLVPLAQLSLLDHMTRNLYSSFLLMDSSAEAIDTGEKVWLTASAPPSSSSSSSSFNFSLSPLRRCSKFFLKCQL